MTVARQLLLVGALVAAAAGFCPTGCRCSDDGPSVSCEGASLTNVPILLNPRIRSLTLRNNRISSVTLDELSIYPDLEYLDLSFNSILSLDSGAFYRLQRLRVLRLNANLLTSLVAETFAGLAELRLLDLSENAFSRLPTSAFVDLRNLEVLNVSTNALKSMSPGAFAGLGSLKELHLDRNELSVVPKVALHATKALKLLDLSRNDISFIKNESFVLLENLEILQLQQNSLETVDDNGFVGLRSLRLLQLDHNNLYRVPTMSFRVLTELDVLEIGHNLFEQLPTSAFEGLGRLRQLIITDCAQLRSVELNAFSGLYELDTLMLSRNPLLSQVHPLVLERPNSVRRLLLNGNALESLPRQLIDWSQLSELDLRANPWRCSCDFGWVAGALELIYGERSGQYVGAQCAAPPALVGESLAELRDETLRCATVDSRRDAVLVTLAALLGALFVCSVAAICLVRQRKRLGRLCCPRDTESQKGLYYQRAEPSPYLPYSAADYERTDSNKSLLYARCTPPLSTHSTLRQSVRPDDYLGYIGAAAPPHRTHCVDCPPVPIGNFRILATRPVPITEL